MRIIAGSLRGRRLATFSGRQVRPTPDRVREAIFSILASRLGTLTGARVLDLFAGTGAMALEALSRGAAHAWLVDQGKAAGDVIPANIGACALTARATFLRRAVDKALPEMRRHAPFDLIFLDPPYGQGLVPATLASLAEPGILAPAGLIVAETERGDAVADRYGGLVRLECRPYGITAVHLFACASEESP